MARDDDDFEEEARPRKPRRRDDDLDDRPARPAAKSKVPLVLGIVAGVLLLVCCGGGALVYFGFTKVRDASGRMVATNNMKQIGLGAENYLFTNGAMPTNSYDAAGKPLLSWRVHILPFIEQEALYRQFHLNEPWDSPHNKTLLAQMPQTYATPAQRKGGATTKTYYRGFAMPGALMEPPPAARRNDPRPGVKQADIKDGPSNTILCVEAGEAVDWTKPDDLAWVFGQPVPAFGADRDANEFLVCFADGSVRAVSKKIAPDQLKAAITYAGKDTANLD